MTQKNRTSFMHDPLGKFYCSIQFIERKHFSRTEMNTEELKSVKSSHFSSLKSSFNIPAKSWIRATTFPIGKIQ